MGSKLFALPQYPEGLLHTGIALNRKDAARMRRTRSCAFD